MRLSLSVNVVVARRIVVEDRSVTPECPRVTLRLQKIQRSARGVPLSLPSWSSQCLNISKTVRDSSKVTPND